MSDPLGRKHQMRRRPPGRHLVDNVCNYILEHEKKDFYSDHERPSAKHVYFDAYAVIYGVDSAMTMLRDAQKEWDL